MRNVLRAFTDRTPKTFPNLEAVRVANAARASAIHPLSGRNYNILVDTREAPLRNDREFESEAQEWRKQMFSSFTKVAILVRTAVGVLQLKRMGRELEVDPSHERVRIFENDEGAALAYLAEP